MTLEELKESRRLLFDKMEQELCKGKTPEDSSVFYYHSSEDHIVLSHALFWVMTQSVTGRLSKDKTFILLRHYQEQMLDAYLTEDVNFSELLRYCNICYNYLPYILTGLYDIRHDKAAQKLAAISTVASGYGGDMSDNLCDELLDDLCFEFNKVSCPKIVKMLPQLNRMVENELNAMMSML